MDTAVCRVNTALRYRWLTFVSFSLLAFAEAQAQQQRGHWRKLGNSSVEMGLAGAATGPMSAVWFSLDGQTLFARTQSGITWESVDGENWKLARSAVIRPSAISSPALHHLPESRSSIRASSGNRIYALGADVYASEDEGRSWLNLTNYQHHSVIGSGQHDLTISPLDPQLIVVANDRGLWRSRDGGLSWSSLNEELPNLPIREIVAVGPLSGGLRVSIEGVGLAELETASGAWRQVFLDSGPEEEQKQVSALLGTNITALSGSGDTWYAGSAEGKIWVSVDKRQTWTLSNAVVGGPVERIAVNPETPRIALVAYGTRGAHIFRTVNGGQLWDDITGTLSDAPAHGITADWSAGAVYVATDRGVFLSRMDLSALGSPSPWRTVDAELPAARTLDVKLDAEGNQLETALEGYGLYETAAPHKAGTIRLVNAADLSQRAAAPGSLYSVIGTSLRAAYAGTTSFPVLARSPEGSQIQIPFETKESQLRLTLESTTGTATTLRLAVKPISPVIFLDRDGAPLLLDGDTGLMLEQQTPIRPRSRFQLLVTGLGQVTPAWPSGMPAPAEHPPAVVADMQAFLNGSAVPVIKSTLAPGYVGLYLVEVELPPLLDAGLMEFYLVADGQGSNRVRLTIATVN